MRIYISVIFLLLGINVMANIQFYYDSEYLSGFEKEVSGETINYYTLNANAFDALLVRSLDAKDFIEWQTQPVPADNKNNILTFVVLASLQVTQDPHTFTVLINDKKYFTFSNPTERSLNPIIINGLNDSKIEFTNLEYDRFDDLTGFLYFHLPVKDFPAGKPIHIRVAGETAKSRTWFMVFKHPCRSNVVLSSENVILNTPEKQNQSMRLKILHMSSPAKASIRIGSTETSFDLNFGFNSLFAGVDEISGETELPVVFKIEDKTIGTLSHKFKPVTPVTIYLLPHSHVDIGYTHVQDEVKRLQYQHIEDAIELAEQTKDYPKEAQCRWNTEVLWAPESYLRTADENKKKKFIDAVQKGIIGLDGMYANILTGLCSREEWTWMAEMIRKINDECDINIESAMISDIPGWSWSIVPMLAHSGIKYLSLGINQGDRIGHVRKELGDKPFYWVSPSGKDKILTWVHEQGYSAFHYISKSGSSGGISVLEPVLINYTNKLADEKYPYDLVPLHYTIGSDNGPVDKYLSDNVKEWNKRYSSPKLVISTTADFFRAFEKKYGKQLPELSGDITPYWEDGAASSAYETSLNRQTADKLTQAMNLFAQYAPEACPIDSFLYAWRNVLLFDEHTWGSWNSVSEPEIEFTKQQWKVKRSYVLESSRMAENLYTSAVSILSAKKNNDAVFDVLNTSHIVQTNVVYLPDEYTEKLNSGLTIVNNDGGGVAVQKMSDGSYAFLTSDVPAFGSKRYYIAKADKQMQYNPVHIDSRVLKNEFIELELDNEKGFLKSMKLTGQGENLIDNSHQWGLGSYIYVEGRKPNNPLTHSEFKIKIKENGPVISSWLLQFKAPGSNLIEQEIILTAGSKRVEMNYTIDKQKIYTPEAVRIAFPMNIPERTVTVENAFGIYGIGKHQLKAANKNFFTLNNFVDLSNSHSGVTIISPDAPLIESGGFTNDASVIGWLDSVREGSGFFSYVMNNYWHTNYLAAQEGRSSYRYSLYPHNTFNASQAASYAVHYDHPLIVIPADKNTQPSSPLIKYNNRDVIMVSIQPLNSGKSSWIAFYNSAEKDTELKLEFANKPKAVYSSDMLKNRIELSDPDVSIPSFDLKYFVIEWE